MEYPRCLYGGGHAGDMYAVRNQRGVTVAGLCAAHERADWNDATHPGYHLRTWEELAEREGGNSANQQGYERMGGARPQDARGGDAARTGTAARIHRDPAYQEQESRDDNSSPSEEGVVTVRGSADALGARGEEYPLDASRHPDDITDRDTQGAAPAQQGAMGKEIARRGAAPPRGAVRAAGSTYQDTLAPIAWWQGAGEMVLETEQVALLRLPFPPTLFERNFDGEWYLPWIYCWQRILDVFAPSIPQLVPISSPQVVGDAIAIHYVMLVNGQFAGEAWGEGQKKGGNRKMTFGNACESAKSEAIRRIGKTLGINLELWEPETIRNLERSKKRG